VESITSNASKAFHKLEENLKSIIDLVPRARKNDTLATKRARFRSQIKNRPSPIKLLNVFGYLMVYGGGLYLLIMGGFCFSVLSGLICFRKNDLEVKAS
jgi:hypothetical protein